MTATEIGEERHLRLATSFLQPGNRANATPAARVGQLYQLWLTATHTKSSKKSLATWTSSTGSAVEPDAWYHQCRSRMPTAVFLPFLPRASLRNAYMQGESPSS